MIVFINIGYTWLLAVSRKMSFIGDKDTLPSTIKPKPKPKGTIVARALGPLPNNQDNPVQIDKKSVPSQEPVKQVKQDKSIMFTPGSVSQAVPVQIDKKSVLSQEPVKPKKPLVMFTPGSESQAVPVQIDKKTASETSVSLNDITLNSNAQNNTLNNALNDMQNTKVDDIWLPSNAILFIIFLILILYTFAFSIDTLINIDKIKADWPNNRCNPIYIPFASYFGVNTKENFEYCMGNIFKTNSLPFIGSIGTLFTKFSGLLSYIFNSLNSLRNIIATLGGGINVIFQEFTDRITGFFFKLRMSALHIKSLFGRMYALLFSVMYMGMSGITGMTSFTNTTLFSFLDTFCFPGDTMLICNDKFEKIPIKNIKIGDVLHPGNAVVTATFKFYSRGQPMVQLGNTVVSTNHYIMYKGHPIKAGNHPCAISVGDWNSDELLYCLNTNTHTIPVEYLTFMDYDETSSGDEETMSYIEYKLNGLKPVVDKEYKYTEYGFGVKECTKIKTHTGKLIMAKDINIGDKLSTGSTVVGIIRKQAHELCEFPTLTITPSTLYYKTNKWVRYGDEYPIVYKTMEVVSLVVVPNSQIELEDGTYVRDYMELCSPDAETYYSKHLEQSSI